MTWKQTPIRAIYRRVEERGREDLPLLSVYRDHGVVPRGDRDDNNNRPSEDLSTYKYVRPGDLVVNKMKTWQGSLAVSGHEGIVSPAYFVGRRVAAVDDRFMHHLLRSLPLIAEYGARSKGIRPAQWDLPWGEFASIKIALPPVESQRAIADYLDTETARIDALIAKKQRMIDLHVLRRSTMIARAVTIGDVETEVTTTGNPFAPIVKAGWQIQRLRHVVSEIVDTAHKTAPVVDGGGFLVVRTANVKAGVLNLDGAHYTDEDSWREWTARGVPQPGDVIFTREAPAGEACLVPEGLPLCIGQRTVLLRPLRTKVRGEWILHSLYSGAAQRFIEVLSRSTTVAHINMSDIPDIPIVVPTLPEQDRILHLIRAEAHRVQSIVEAMTRQTTLLRERRQALITAAVTGELEIPVVAA